MELVFLVEEPSMKKVLDVILPQIISDDTSFRVIPHNGKSEKPYLVRIVCHELEAWYFGDLNAVSRSYGIDADKIRGKRKYRVPDEIVNAKREFKKLVPQHQQITGAALIAKYMDVNSNKSKSFQVFVDGVRKMERLKI